MDAHAFAAQAFCMPKQAGNTCAVDQAFRTPTAPKASYLSKMDIYPF
jgi:hypothetical protein